MSRIVLGYAMYTNIFSKLHIPLPPAMESQNSHTLHKVFITEIQNWFTCNPKTKDKIRKMDELVLFENNALLIQVEALDGQFVMKYFNRDRFKDTATNLADKITAVLKLKMKAIELHSYQLHIKVKYLSYLHERRIEIRVYD